MGGGGTEVAQAPSKDVASKATHDRAKINGEFLKKERVRAGTAAAGCSVVATDRHFNRMRPSIAP
jgi:hypothetical protein